MSSETNNKLNYPIPEKLVNFIKAEHPVAADSIVSSIEYVIKTSNSQYSDLIKILDPIINEGTEAFVNKLFMCDKRACRMGIYCQNKICLFSHPDVKKRPLSDSGVEVKRPKLNREVVFNKVDENKFTQSDVETYAMKFGTVDRVRRLNVGKFLIVFEEHSSAQKVVDSTDPVLNDAQIKKFFNVLLQEKVTVTTTTQVKNVKNRNSFDIVELLNQQKKYIDEIDVNGSTDVDALKIVSLRIKNYILQKEGKLPPKPRKQPETTGDSIYSNLFS